MKTHPHRVIFLNGPPRCGKDFGAGLLLKELFRSRTAKFSQPLKRAIAEQFQLTDEEQKYLEANKDTPQKLLNGYTYRQAQINLSEHHMKPLYGDDVFGQILRRVLSRKVGLAAHDYTIISDSGFRSEAEPVVSTFGGHNCLLIRLSRPGTSFEGDSRTYINLDDLGVHSVDIVNMLEPEMYVLQLMKRIEAVWPDTKKD